MANLISMPDILCTFFIEVASDRLTHNGGASTEITGFAHMALALNLKNDAVPVTLTGSLSTKKERCCNLFGGVTDSRVHCQYFYPDSRCNSILTSSYTITPSL